MDEANRAGGRHRARAVALVIASTCVLLLPVVTARATGYPPYPFMESMSCPSSTLCVGGDDRGRIVRSLDPPSAQPTWSVQRVGGFEVPWGAISCLSELCTAVNINGYSMATTEPAAPSPAWDPETLIERGELTSPFGLVDSISEQEVVEHASARDAEQGAERVPQDRRRPAAATDPTAALGSAWREAL